MITQTIKAAMTENPYVIFPYGKIEQEELKCGLQNIKYEFPEELINFWEEFGGGELFEVETILYPLKSNDELIDDLITTNEFYHANGLENKYIVFQKNAAQLTVFDIETNEVVLLSNGDFIERQRFENITNWFLHFWQVHEA